VQFLTFDLPIYQSQKLGPGSAVPERTEYKLRRDRDGWELLQAMRLTGDPDDVASPDLYVR
jgi:hypothetical protein